MANLVRRVEKLEQAAQAAQPEVVFTVDDLKTVRFNLAAWYRSNFPGQPRAEERAAQLEQSLTDDEDRAIALNRGGRP